MDGEYQNGEYQNDIIAEKFFHSTEVHSVHESTEPETADQEYENDNQEYEYIKYSDMRMRKLPEVGVKRDSVLFASERGQWGDIRRRHFIAFSFLLLLSLILAITALVLACLRCFSECPHGWKKLDEKCYNFSLEPKKWAVARSHCQDQGADLVVIDSEREREFLDYKMDKKFWLGLFYEEDERAWKWVNEKNGFYSYLKSGCAQRCVPKDSCPLASSLTIIALSREEELLGPEQSSSSPLPDFGEITFLPALTADVFFKVHFYA